MYIQTEVAFNTGIRATTHPLVLCTSRPFEVHIKMLYFYFKSVGMQKGNLKNENLI